MRGVDHHALAADDRIAAAVHAAEVELGDTGRVLLRPSGTEPLVRVMVEARDSVVAHAIAERLAGIVREQLALV